jgi:hypothetical protein
MLIEMKNIAYCLYCKGFYSYQRIFTKKHEEILSALPFGASPQGLIKAFLIRLRAVQATPEAERVSAVKIFFVSFFIDWKKGTNKLFRYASNPRFHTNTIVI